MSDDLDVLKSAALLFFLAFWVVIAIRLLCARREPYDAAARIPLSDREVVTPRHDDTKPMGRRDD